MKILQVHKYLYRKAGAEAYMLDLAQLLAENGHDVGMWGTDASPRHSERSASVVKNPALKGTGSFAFAQDDMLVRYLNFDRSEGILRDLKKFGHMVWSTEAAEKFDYVLDIFAPDVIHLHNIYHHISPSILPVAARHRVPVVMTVHDYKLINPNYSLFDHGEICERSGLRAVAHRCIKNSYVSTLADVLEMKIHRAMRVYERYIARFIVPTRFVKEKLMGSGIPHSKIIHLPLPVILNEAKRSEGSRTEKNGILRSAQNDKKSNYILYAGRLTQEKGVYVVLEMAKRLPDVQFKIAGTGPEFENVKLKIKNVKLLNVEALGFLEKDELQKVIAQARLIVVPSLWYEVSPLAVLEAMAQGKVVLASKIGALTNLIAEGKTGFLVSLRNYKNAAKTTKDHNAPQPPLTLRGGDAAWVDMIQKIYYNETLLKKVGQNAKAYVKRVHDPQAHYEKIMEIYKEVSN